MSYVFSTMSSAVEYTFYAEGGGDLPLESRRIRIEGGSGIINKNLITPQGAIATRVTDDELAALKKHPVFQFHQKKGFITVGKSNSDGEKKAVNEGMKIFDGSRQLSEGDFKKPPVSAKEKQRQMEYHE